MDPVTHTLVGACLAATRLGRLAPLAPAALVLGANAPDVDALAYLRSTDAALAARRGWTHGLPALVVLPLLLTGLLLLWDRWRRRRGDPGRPPTRAAPLVAVSGLAILTHPALDWLNTYGMRWLMPIRRDWCYGDAVFIMDPWLWLVLGGAWLLGRRPARGITLGWTLATGLLGLIVAVRAPAHLPVVLAIALLLLLALRRPALAEPARRRAALAGLGVALAYILAMVALQAASETRVRAGLAERGVAPLERLMVGPMPADPSSWEVVAATADAYHLGAWRWLPAPRLDLAERTLPRPRPGATWNRARCDPSIAGFMGWARFPWYEVEERPEGVTVHVMDARYARRRTTGFGGAVVELGGVSPERHGRGAVVLGPPSVQRAVPACRRAVGSATFSGGDTP